ncbi:hypothetical protein BJG01_08310 [Vibrio splendidus]|nr:hypothetical protein BJG01_08310 [Vibrio splendidus]
MFKIGKGGLLYAFVVLVFIAWSVIVRFSGYDRDMVVYELSMVSESLNIYYLKEPVFWVFSRFLYDLFGKSQYVFIFYDVVSFVLLASYIKKSNLPIYTLLLFLCFFPSMMGMQNVYRQYLASIFLLCGFLSSINRESNSKQMLLFIIAGLTHNVAFVFFPLKFIFSNSQYVERKTLFFLCCASVIILLPLALSTKSSNDTGDIPIAAYLILQLIILIFFIFANKGKMLGQWIGYFYIQVFFFVLTLTSSFLVGSAQSKRIGMICLMISLLPMIKVIENRFKGNVSIRLCFFISAAAPALIFASSRNFLLSEIILN